MWWQKCRVNNVRTCEKGVTENIEMTRGAVLVSLEAVKC